MPGAQDFKRGPRPCWNAFGNFPQEADRRSEGSEGRSVSIAPGDSDVAHGRRGQEAVLRRRRGISWESWGGGNLKLLFAGVLS